MSRISFLARISSGWGTFVYNYSWSDWVHYIDGWIPKFSLFFPLVGYLILFNDSVSQSLVFTNLTSSTIEWGLTGPGRLRFLYFGLLFLGVSNFIYRIKKPYSFRLGVNVFEYTRNALEFFTYGDYIEMHGRIRDEGHLTMSGKYYDSEWDGFQQSAVNSGEGTNSVERDGNWEAAKQQYGSLLRSILRESFFRLNIQNRSWLTVCVTFSTVGYALLAVPSMDLFLKVAQSTFL